ncbi:MAG: transcription termination factor Rho, partial [Candidatus Mcinerneyibacterium aminivorans]
MFLEEFQRMEVNTLIKKLEEMEPENKDEFGSLPKNQLLFKIVGNHIKNNERVIAEGVIEVLNEGYGFVRTNKNNYVPSPEDIYVSPNKIKRWRLKTGDTLKGFIRVPKNKEKYFAFTDIMEVNDQPPEESSNRKSFDSLTPYYPTQKLELEVDPKDMSTRIMDLLVPIGKGQRGLIVAPPRTGKTILLQKIANSITSNHPEVELIVLLIDERPEEVTDMKRTVDGEVVSSTFDEHAERHVKVADMVIEKAKSRVEYGKDVVILLDSITRLARANNTIVPHSGKILSGGVDSNALNKPKSFFGSARNIEEGGSLTIIATALVETGSRMDDVIFEEFKGTG